MSYLNRCDAFKTNMLLEFNGAILRLSRRPAIQEPRTDIRRFGWQAARNQALYASPMEGRPIGINDGVVLSVDHAQTRFLMRPLAEACD